MTRINLVPVQHLSDKHLAGEYHEITRIFNLVRNCQEKVGYVRAKRDLIPATFRLGKGHVRFFYDKLGFIINRYKELFYEMELRGNNVNRELFISILKDADTDILQCWRGEWTPSKKDIALSWSRLCERGDYDLVKLGVII